MKTELNVYKAPYTTVKTVVLSANMKDEAVWINRQTDCKYKVLIKFDKIETVSNLTLGQAYWIYDSMLKYL